MLLTVGFIVVTPLDIIVQTWGSPSTWIKTFIVIMACALFLFFCLIIYFLRLYQSRTMLNQIPSKSVYIPIEQNDLPTDVRQYIDGTLRRCIGDIKVRAGPLHNKNEIINFPGASPPEYVQKRNLQMGFQDEGSLLPPNCVYEDILDSLAMQIKYDSRALISFDIPECYSFREIVLYMTRVLLEEKELERSELPDVKQMVKLYEKLKFGPERIKELDMVHFLTLFQKTALLNHSNRLQLQRDDEVSTSLFGKPQDYKHSRGSSYANDARLSPFYKVSRPGLQIGYYSSRSATKSEVFTDEVDSIRAIEPFQSYNAPSVDSHPIISRTSTRASDLARRWTRRSVSSNASVIKSKLVFRGNGKSSKENVLKESLSDQNGDLSSSNESASSVRRLSGFAADSDAPHLKWTDL